jgi:very-short-patch-repair endonuclease
VGYKAANIEQAIAAIAGRQRGVITTGQLRQAGLSRDAVAKRAKAGRLHRVHRGVYAVGHSALSVQERWMAAVLACGDGAVLSHRSAAEHWGLLTLKGGFVHISVPTLSGREKRFGIRIHRRASLHPGDTTERHGISITTPARTVADLRGTVPAAELRRAIRQAEVRGYRTGLDIAARTRSELEDLFLRLCQRHRLPEPEVNVHVAGHEVDFLWRRQRVVAETDGYRFHRGSTAFEDDHERDLDLRASGFAVLRFTYRQVTADPERVATSISKELEAASRQTPTPPIG